MADGAYRFHAPGAGQQQAQYYHTQQQAQSHPRHLARNTSPPNGRISYNNETPSPSRSPVSQASTFNPFTMFNQGHQQSHGMMNGNGHRGFMQMGGLNQHKYSHQQHHGQQNHHHQQNHGGHQAQNTMGHQHSYSGGMMQNSGQNFTQSALQNGTAGDEQDLGEPVSEHWQTQLQLATELRQSGLTPHRHSKKPGAAVLAAKGTIPRPEVETQRDVEQAERRTAIEEQRQDWDGMDLSGQGLRSLSPQMFVDYTFLTKLRIDQNRLGRLPDELCQLRNLTLLDASANQLREIPDGIGMLTNLRTLLLFDNSIRTFPKEIGHLYKLEVLGIDGNPIDEDIKDMLKHGDAQSLIVHIRDRTEPGPAPKEREMIVLDESEAAETFAVLNWNILCHKYATMAQHGYCASKALSWEYRRELILEEIKARDADFLCLQEIDMESFNEFFRRELAFYHYKGVFWPKSRARTMGDKEAKVVDGCAIFYNGQKFILLEKALIDFSNMAINRPDMKGEHDIFNRVMPRDHVAVITFFENRATGSRMILANAHLFWDPVFEDVKLVQTAILMEQVTKLADAWASIPACANKAMFRHSEQDTEADPERPEPPFVEPGPSLEYSSGSQIPVVVSGDFNAGKGSGILELLTRGALPANHADWKNNSYGSFTRDGVYTGLSLKSAYGGEARDHIDFTNYTPGFSGVIDYIWHSSSLTVRRVLGNVDYDYLQKVPGFPNYHFPSDHLSLYAEFAVEARRERPKAVEADFGSTPRERRG